MLQSFMACQIAPCPAVSQFKTKVKAAVPHMKQMASQNGTQARFVSPIGSPTRL